MASHLHRAFLALAASGIAAAGWAQGAPHELAPPPAWHDEGGADSPSLHHPRDGEDGPGRGWGHDRKEGRWHGGWHHHGPFGAAAMEFHGLNLTPEQHRKIEILMLNARLQQLQQEQARKPGAPDDMAALMNPGDPNYAAAVQEAKKRAAEHIQRISDLRLQIYNVLTPEQKAEFARRIEQHKAHMAARHDEERNSKDQPGPAAR